MGSNTPNAEPPKMIRTRLPVGSPRAPKNKWVLRDPSAPTTVDSTRLRIFCIPQAGMGAWAFHCWTSKLPNYVEILPIELPGRNSRMSEPKHRHMSDLVDDLLRGILPLLMDGTPYVVFGHSMGAWIAYELVKAIEKRETVPNPLQLYISANRAPQLAGSENDVDPVELHSLSYEDFWLHFDTRYGASEELKAQSVRKFLWPLLQADFQVIEKYKPGLPLHVGVGICGFGAIDDKRYLPTQMEAWAECAIDKTKNFRLHWLTGGHSYVTKNPDALLAFLAKDLEGLARWEPLPTK